MATMVATMRATTVASKSGIGAGVSVGSAEATLASTVAAKSGVGTGVSVGRASAIAARTVASRLGVPPVEGASVAFEQPATSKTRASRPRALMVLILASVWISNLGDAKWVSAHMDVTGLSSKAKAIGGGIEVRERAGIPVFAGGAALIFVPLVSIDVNE